MELYYSRKQFLTINVNLKAIEVKPSFQISQGSEKGLQVALKRVSGFVLLSYM